METRDPASGERLRRQVGDRPVQGMDNIQIIGRLTRDAELRQTTSGKSVAAMRLAVPRRDRDAAPVYVDVVAYEGLADICAKHLDKGRQVAVTGRLDYREWETDEGQRRSKHEVVADQVDFLAKAQRDAEDES